MALADPQVVTVNAVAQSMPRLQSDGKSAVYANADESFKLSVSHEKPVVKGKTRVRSLARIDQRAIVTNPLDSTNDYDTLTVYLVIDRPEVGFSSTQVDQLVSGFKTWLTSTMVGTLYGQQS